MREIYNIIIVISDFVMWWNFKNCCSHTSNRAYAHACN